MKPDYAFNEKLCVVSYKDSIDFEYCQNNPIIDKDYCLKADCFILDLQKVAFIDSAGIGSLVNTQLELNNQGKSLCLVNLCPVLKKVLKISEIEHVFPIFNSLPDAKYHYKSI